MEPLEVTVFKRKITLLRDGIQDDVDNVALHLYAKDLIGRNVREEATLRSTPSGQRAIALLFAVENRIRTTPANFRTVIETFDSLPHLRHLVGPLEAEFQQLRDTQRTQHSESSSSHSEIVATTPLPYSSDRSTLVQRPPSPLALRPSLTDFQNVSTPDIDASISPNEQIDGGIPHQRPSRSSADGSSASESEDTSTVFQRPVHESPKAKRSASLPVVSRAPIETSVPSEYSSELFKQEVHRKIHQAGDTLNDLHTFIVEKFDQHRNDEIARLKDQVDGLELSKLEDAQRYKEKIANAEKKAADAEESVKQLGTVLFRVALQLNQKDRTITAQKQEICSLKENAKTFQAEKEKIQAQAKELIEKKELELQAEQAEKQQLETELRKAQRKFKDLEERNYNLQEKFKKKRRNLSWS